MNDPSPTSLVNMHGAQVRDRFPDVEKAIRRSVDFVRTNFYLRHIKFLPYGSLLVPLAAFFSIRPNEPVTGDQHLVLVKWFWRACFSHRYSGNPQRNIKRDIEECVKLRQGSASQLAEIAVSVDQRYFIENTFSFRTVASKTLILLLASLHPRTLLSGELVQLDEVLSEPNRREYHHCFPRAYLASQGRTPAEINALANFAIVSRGENREISNRRPSSYRALMPPDTTAIQVAAMLPDSLFSDNYDAFLYERAARLVQVARERAGVYITDGSRSS